jgi:hypothetical protein
MQINLRDSSAQIFRQLFFAKTSPRPSFLVIENEGFVLVFAKPGSINSVTGETKREGTSVRQHVESVIQHCEYVRQHTVENL